jgi:hypothetical protein
MFRLYFCIYFPTLLYMANHGVSKTVCTKPFYLQNAAGLPINVTTRACKGNCCCVTWRVWGEIEHLSSI